MLCSFWGVLVGVRSGCWLWEVWNEARGTPRLLRWFPAFSPHHVKFQGFQGLRRHLDQEAYASGASKILLRKSQNYLILAEAHQACVVWRSVVLGIYIDVGPKAKDKN